MILIRIHYNYEFKWSGQNGEAAKNEVDQLDQEADDKADLQPIEDKREDSHIDGADDIGENERDVDEKKELSDVFMEDKGRIEVV